MNPFLVRYRVEGLCAAQLRYVRGSRRCQLTAIGRKGTSFCSVPMAELHAKGLGNAAHGRSARLGGLVSRQELEGLTGTVIAGPDHQGFYHMKMMIEEGELDTVVVSAENITLRLRRSALPELARSTGSELPEAPLELEGVSFLASMASRSRPESLEQAEPNARPKVQFCPTVSVEPISARSSRVVSLSAAAAECLLASGDVSQHALTEVFVTDDCSGRDQKFEDLDNELSKYREGSGVAPRLASTQALGPPLQQKS
ncbi:bglB [Symbiodinium microadriaticum]|nr:bglB [Symbiodinium sp. KB8]CAE7872158.1 bglB [Symbiodinium microadriaticum]